jgi:uroporphyrin-3 C-methyltransferase
MRGLIRVERLIAARRPTSPNQAFFLRENLKLRLVNARLALLQRDGRSFREDLRQARDWLERYFDRRAKPVQNAIATLNSLAATDLSIDAPGLNETLAALRSNRLRPGGGARR